MELFRIFGRIAIDNDQAIRELDETTVKGEQAHSKMSGAFAKIGNAAKVAGKAIAAGMAVAGAGIVKISKDAVASYAEYEQLVGGVETLFKDSSDQVLKYAQNAYKTAGLSANQYMETVTSFSASLLQSLDGDTAKSAEVADRAIRDMSDNANKMGTSMEMIQNAYQGFAKQNYTMLDNLKLGYGGTQEEMKRLIADASKMTDVQKDLNIEVKDGDMSFANIANAISVVQTKMGITGTTALEASTTIQGSIASMKSAWQNLLTAMADPEQNLDTVFQQFVDSVVTVGDNLIPRIQMLLPRVVEGVSKLAEQLANYLPEITESLLPSLLTGAVNIVTALITKFPALCQSIITALVKTLKSYGSQVKKSGQETLDKITEGIASNLPKIVQKAAEIITKLVSGLSNNLPKVVVAAGKIIASIIQGLVASLPSLLAQAPKLIASFAKGLTGSLGAIVNVGFNLVKGLWNGISNAKDWVLGKIKGFGQSILDGIKGFFGIHSPSKVMEEEVGVQLALGVAEGIDKGKGKAKKSAEEMGKEILDSAERTLTEYKRMHDMSAVEEARYWQTIVQSTKKGTEARIQAEDKYYSALESYKQQYESYVNDIMEQMNLFEAFTMKVDEENPITGHGLIANLQSQISGLQDYYSTIESLNSRIGGTQLMSYLSTLNTDNLAELQAINSMTDEQLQQYVNLYDQKYKLACDKATEALGTINKSVEDETKSANKTTATALKTMTDNVKKYSNQMASQVQTKFSNIASSVSSNMARAVSAVKSAVAEMNAALASAPTAGTVATTTTSTKTTVKKNAEGGILTKPTIFGYTPSTGQWQMGGEAGHEAIAPIDTLQKYVRSAVAEETAEQNALFERMVRLLEGILDKDTSVYLNSKEISKAVNRDLGVIY